jgi:D-alanyl-D-alanine carboxypeptidase (penicillin-binding protein 5/6)
MADEEPTEGTFGEGEIAQAGEGSSSVRVLGKGEVRAVLQPIRPRVQPGSATGSGMRILGTRKQASEQAQSVVPEMGRAGAKMSLVKAERTRRRARGEAIALLSAWGMEIADRARGHGRRSRARSLGRTLLRVVVGLLILVVAAGALAIYQLVRPLPKLQVALVVPRQIRLPGTPPGLPWPAQGEAALYVVGKGWLGPVGGEQAVPIASVAKIMTALVVLRDHPLAPGSSGPLIPIEASDVLAYRAELAQRDSVVAVAPGERLTERQALEALLVASADNVADILARWDSGSIANFVAKMDATARLLGLSHTHYADASGLSQQTTSDAIDQVKLAMVAMRNPVFAQIVAMPEVTLPVAGTVVSYNYDLGKDGIVGVKTGSDAAAGGCLVFLAKNPGEPAIYGAILGQQSSTSTLDAVLQDALRLITPAEHAFVDAHIWQEGETLGYLKSPWGQHTAVVAASPVSVVGMSGSPVRISVVLDLPTPPFGSATTVGRLDVYASGREIEVPLRTLAGMGGPSLSWRLRRL